MDDQPPSRPVLDDELRETLDMLGTVVASMSDRLDDQTALLDRVNKTATEARQAAFAARAQTAPENYGRVIAETLGQHLDNALATMERSENLLDRQTDRTVRALDRAEKEKSETLGQIMDRERKVADRERRLPLFCLVAVVLALVAALLLPRFSAYSATTCNIAGGDWLRASGGQMACVQYQG